MSNVCLEDFIVEIPNFISKEECDCIIDMFNDADDHFKYTGTVNVFDKEGNMSRTACSVKSSTDMNLGGSGSATGLFYSNIIREKLMKSLQYYMDVVTMKCRTFGEVLHRVLSPNATLTTTDPILQRTGPGQEFKWHVDTTGYRLFAFILYLNNSDAFEGGYTDFLHRRVVPEAGKLLIFPAQDCMLHRGAVVERGFKYIITAFCVYKNKPFIKIKNECEKGIRFQRL